jgi:hypothetical protein
MICAYFIPSDHYDAKKNSQSSKLPSPIYNLIILGRVGRFLFVVPKATHDFGIQCELSKIHLPELSHANQPDNWWLKVISFKPPLLQERRVHVNVVAMHLEICFIGQYKLSKSKPGVWNHLPDCVQSPWLCVNHITERQVVVLAPQQCNIDGH